MIRKVKNKNLTMNLLKIYGNTKKGEKMKWFFGKNPYILRVAVFVFGALGYGIVELLWRGRTHWSMLFAGGICFSVYYRLCKDAPGMPLLMKCFWGAVVITSVELMFGTVVNVAWHLDVWDYTNMPFHFFGQICLPFFALWFLLCIPLTFLCDMIRKKTEDTWKKQPVSS